MIGWPVIVRRQRTDELWSSFKLNACSSLPPRLQKTVDQRTQLFESFHQGKCVLLKSIPVNFNPALHESQWPMVHTHVGPSVARGRKAISEIAGEVSTGDRITFQLSQFQSMNVIDRTGLPH